MHFCGWVPTVTGHLSFTTLATGSFPSRCWRRECGKRFVAVQRRDLLDVLVPYAESVEVINYFREKLSNIVVGISGRFWYILDAVEAEDGETLKGIIHMVPATNNKPFVKQLKTWLANTGALSGVDQMMHSTKNASCYTVKFSLERGGKASLFPETNGQGSELRHLLANQTFFFLKDISHVHQHHHPSHDAITEVCEISDKHSKEHWVTQTQFSLYRAIIRFKRFKNEKALFRAAGILAYAQSFDRRYGSENSPAKNYHVGELKESLAVGREEIKYFQGKTLSVSETLRGFFFAAFGLVAAAGIFARLSGKQDFEVDSSIIAIAEFVASKPWSAVGLTALASFVWAFATHRIDPSEVRFVRTSLRLIQGFQLRWAFLFQTFITLLLIILTYVLLR